ncbi:tetratricopeptide repeat protein [Sphingomonas cavernae]|uniref:Uncharacterized protein n=1 Tax=Sphingomonas cavernae TaxID=2320861 RepID=A0A418WQG0_9SPHN|nr:tetratricopeptide repeat protein [Sphingomonas cavernae]RJF93483.1 hypothetical protein D3876_03945 [Sphingomonas cavernae]
MISFAKPILLAVAATALMGVAPAPPPSPQLLELLDPTRTMRNLCGSSREAGKILRQRLQFAAAWQAQQAGSGGAMPLLTGLGGTHFTITTRDPMAQRYFDQGLMLAYGFNHHGAIGAFRAAQRRDPQCAMCFWGEALAYGPNINAPMDAASLVPTMTALRRATALQAGATPVEQALIDALGARYSVAKAADRAELDMAYADAMLKVAARFPEHDDAAILAAEAVMDTSPWNYWEADGRTPKGKIGEAVTLIERVMARNPAHAQAAHVYIHLVEASDAKRAEAAADRLARPLVPAAGHLVHMPSHIYYVLGRFDDSIRVNIDAVRADEAWLKASGDKGIYRYGYYPHNVHFLVTSAQMLGDMKTAITEARRLRALLDPDVSASIAWIQAIDAAPYQAYAQFAAPEEILALPAPDPRLPYVTAMRHYARAVAYAQQRDDARANAEIAAIGKLRTTNDFAGEIAQGMPAPDLLQLAELVAQGRLSYAHGRYAEAAKHYRDAIAVEDKLTYMEPPWWYYPVHQSLGAALLRAGDREGARQAFMTALAKSPDNAWALYGLMTAQQALGQTTEAAATRAAHLRRWRGHDGWLSIDRL